ncbi:sodium- and chloride-dependent GABA transporter 1-like [Condylostylus longicornis]|uniref:sodium- and chloride-dependent GABA transporter 1-like n=1 Tax=Condylostylus longicornis TaxID=2530218 RepID=UPI00244E4624|nr:sodium- and chloride-dependent GABA transporter 1-like [Condylostylus longicornis]
MLTNIRENVSKTFSHLTTVINNHVTATCDSANKITKRDENRGKPWTSNWDFYATCFCHAFTMKHFLVFPKFMFHHWAFLVVFLVSYFVDLFIFTLPIFFIQGFLGQFSSSGFISAYRAAPIAKGLGYVILILNVITSSYYSVNAAVPLIFFLSSFNTVLPWTTCNNGWNTIDCKDDPPKLHPVALNYYFTGKTLASTEFFYKAIAQEDTEGWQISWRIFLSTTFVWILIGILVMKGVNIISKYLRYATIITFIIMLIIFLRILCLPGTIRTFERIILPKESLSKMSSSLLPYSTNTIITSSSSSASSKSMTSSSLSSSTTQSNTPITIVNLFITWVYAAAPATFALGPGWGSIVTMASFNNFNEKLKKLTYKVCFGHMLIIIITGMSTFLVRRYLAEYYDFFYKLGGVNQLDYVYTAFPYFFGKLEVSQLWSLLFYAMLFLAEFSSCIIQIFAVITALFDEHESIRVKRKEIVITLLLALYFSALVFATNRGFLMFALRYSIEGIIQMSICLLELMAIVWIYGRMRFQRDVFFMLGLNFKTWKFFSIRFITPLGIILVLSYYIIVACIDVFDNKQVLNPASLITFKLIPFFIFIPGYIVIKLFPFNDDRTAKEKIKELLYPTDWFPAEPEICQKYIEEYGAPETPEPSDIVDLEPQIKMTQIGNGDLSQLRRISADVDICIEFDI